MAFILHGVLQMFGFGSGVIKGKGKGTDDAVKMGLQKGAYVMPADSTKQIGAEQLGALGKGFVPAHVSNGEFHLPPEQVHGLGVQVLDAMKDATHKPVPDKQGLSFGVYLANGGVVKHDVDGDTFFYNTKKYANDMNQQIVDSLAKGKTAKASGQTLRMATIGIPTRVTEDVIENTLNASLFPVAEQIGYGFDTAVDFGKGLLDLNDKPKQAVPKQQERKPVGAESTNTPKLPPVITQESLTPKIATSADGKSAEQVRAENRALWFASPQSRPNVTPQFDAKGYLVGDSKGISFAPTPVNQGFGGAGVGDAPKEQPFVATIGETPDPRKSAAWRAASTPHAGAQNRQLTANQINAMRSMLADEERNQVALQQTAMGNATQSANIQANNQAALAREAMQQQGALMRDGINQASQDRRLSMQQAQQQGQFDVANAFNGRKQANQEQLDAIKIEQAKRLQNLQNALLSAQSDADKSAIAKQIAMLNGEFKSSDGFNRDQFMKLKQTTIGEDGMPIEQENVVDLKARQFMFGESGDKDKQRVGTTPDGKVVFVNKAGKYFVE